MDVPEKSTQEQQQPTNNTIAQEQELTKKQQKKLKLKQKKAEGAPKTTAQKEETKSMSDILFQPSSESEEFSRQSLFSNTYYGQGLNKIESSTVFTLTPAQLYAQIREIAEARFSHQLPE